MSELKVHCLFFPGEICPPECPNHKATEQNIIRTAGDLNISPECVASRIRIDPTLKIWTRCQAQLNGEGLVQCVHNPQQ